MQIVYQIIINLVMNIVHATYCVINISVKITMFYLV